MSQYKMPKIEKGDPVLWHAGGDVTQTSGDPGIVICVHPEMVDIATLVNGSNVRVKHSVRHVSDPRFTVNRNPHTVEMGGWDYSPLMKRLVQLEGAILEPKKGK